MADAILADVNSSGIYQIRNLVNGKRYIGSAVCLAQRWRQHRCELGKGRHNPRMQNAWRKYGEQAFVFEIVEIVSEKERLIAREQHYLDVLKPEYNVAVTAGSNLGVKWSDDVKRKMSAANKMVWQALGHRQKMSESHKGQVISAEHRRKISAANTGRKLSESHAAAVAENNAKRNRSEEHRARLSAFWKGRSKTAEQLEKMAATKRGKPAHNRGKAMTAEQKVKQSEAMKAKYRDPAFREKIRDTTRAAMKRPEVAAKVAAAKLGSQHSEETRKKMSVSQRRAWARRKALQSGISHEQSSN